MKKLIIFFLPFFVSLTLAQTQPSINWISIDKTIGLYLSNLDIDKDENISINVINPLGTSPKFVEKISKSNQILFKHQYYDECGIKTNIFFDQSGNFYELGSYLRKYDSGGLLQWALLLFYKELTTPDFLYVLPTREIIVGSIWQNKYLITKYSESGQIIWDKYLPVMRDFVSQRISDKNGNLYLKGYAWSDSSNSSVFSSIVKVDVNGNAIWRKDYAADLIIFDKNENLVLQGISKLNDIGIVIWSSQEKVFPRDMCFDLENNLYAIGNTIDSQYIMKLDGMGKTLWQKTYFQKSPVPQCWIDYNGYCNALINNCLIKFDKDGNEIWHYTLTHDGLGRYDIRYAIQVKQDIILGGTLWDGGIFIASISDPTPTTIESENYLPTKFSLSQNYPNPFNPGTTIEYTIPANVKGETAKVTLKVYDLLGREVATLVDEYKQPGTYNCKLRIENGELPSGIYFFRLQSGSYSETKKLILMK